MDNQLVRCMDQWTDRQADNWEVNPMCQPAYAAFTIIVHVSITVSCHRTALFKTPGADITDNVITGSL